ncbi:hypothetical protein GCM10023238_16180 [Streptomyces heliomycini]
MPVARRTGGSGGRCAGGRGRSTDVSEIARALRESPVYVDPAAQDILAKSDAEALANKIEDADEPVFVAVLPADYPTQDLFQNLRTETGVTGLYGIRLGDRFDARADKQRAQPSGRAEPGHVRAGAGDAKAQLNDFVDSALRNTGGSAPNSWSDGSSGVPVGGLITVGALAAAGGAGVYAVSRRNRRRREEEQRSALEKLRVVVGRGHHRVRRGARPPRLPSRRTRRGRRDARGLRARAGRL